MAGLRHAVGELNDNRFGMLSKKSSPVEAILHPRPSFTHDPPLPSGPFTYMLEGTFIITYIYI